jgi:hypothetical protein
MHPYDLIYLGRTRFHLHCDATAMYFRVLRAGRYIGAYAGAVAGPDMTSVGPKPSRALWAALAHVTSRGIGVRLMGSIRSEQELHCAETIWIKAADLRAHLGKELTLPVEDEIYTSFTFDEDPWPTEDSGPTPALSGTSTRIGLKAASAGTYPRP